MQLFLFLIHPVLCFHHLQAHCFEEENECLECQILDLEDRLKRKKVSFSSTVAVPDSSLDAVVKRLRKERVGLLDVSMCDGMSNLGSLLDTPWESTHMCKGMQAFPSNPLYQFCHCNRQERHSNPSQEH